MKNTAIPCFYVPTSKQLFDFHMQSLLQKKCPGQKRLDRLFDLYQCTCEGRIEWTEDGYYHVRSSVESYKNVSDGTITADFRLLRQAFLVFVCGEKPSPSAKILADLFASFAKDNTKIPVDFSKILNEGTGSVEQTLNNLMENITPNNSAQ